MMPEEADIVERRREMIERQLRRRGISDSRVLAAFSAVPRHCFVEPSLIKESYGDHPLPIGEGQTISQPYIVALMTQALRLNPEDTVLEIGTGSGYQSSILSRLCKMVYTVERIPLLLERSQVLFKEFGYENIQVMTGDGTYGWKEHAPYDKIIVTAGAPHLPEPLKKQVKNGGRIVIPIGNTFSQVLILFEKRADEFSEKSICDCIFVSLIGNHGWKSSD